MLLLPWQCWSERLQLLIHGHRWSPGQWSPGQWHPATEEQRSCLSLLPAAENRERPRSFISERCRRAGLYPVLATEAGASLVDPGRTCSVIPRRMKIGDPSSGSKIKREAGGV